MRRTRGVHIERAMSVLVGIDFGSSRVGVAVSDPEKKLAFPFDVISREGGSYGFRKLRALLEERSVEAFVVGMPYRSDGSRGQECEKAQEYMDALHEYFQKDVIPWDERFTTVLARQSLIDAGSRKKVRKKERGAADRIAAQLILQSYLDHRNQVSSQHRSG